MIEIPQDGSSQPVESSGVAAMDVPTHSLIGYSPVEGGEPGGRGVNPATLTELEPQFVAASFDQAGAAAELARAAFPAYAALNPQRRAEFLHAVAAGLEEAREEIQARMVAETGLPLARAKAELARTVAQWRRYGDFGASAEFLGRERVEGGPGQPALESRRVPLGPVLVFGAGNFPLAYGAAGGDVASALAAGCPVLALAHRGHPGTAALVGGVIQRVAEAEGMPEGVYALLHGPGRELGQHLLRHPGLAAVGFTGSRSGGLGIWQTANQRQVPIPVFAEMSSVNPMIFGPEALAARGAGLVEKIHASATDQGGQFCTAPGLLFVPRSGAGEAFAEALAAAFEATPAATMLSAGIAEHFARSLRELEGGRGVRVRARGQAAGPEPRASGRAALLEVDLADFQADLERQQAEVFGPASLLVRYESLRELPAVLDALDGQLTVSLHFGPVELAASGELIAAAERRAGRVVFDGVPTGVAVNAAQVHAGPFPATFDGSTSVGEHALLRWTRRVAWQNAPEEISEA